MENGLDNSASATSAYTRVGRTNTNYRRNGKLQSCEPCRKSKLRCDHLMPTCGRCLHRKKPEACIYHPAPLTKPKFDDRLLHSSSKSPESTPKAPNTYCLNETAQLRAIPSRPDPSSVCPSTPSLSCNTSDEKPPSGGSSFRLHRNSGCLGITSYRSILKETPESPSLDNVDQGHEDNIVLGDEKIQKGAEILALLTHLPAYERFIQRWFDISQGILVIEPMVNQWTEALWQFHGDVLTERNQHQLRQMSKLIWKNTQNILKFDGTTTAYHWTAMSSGSQLRWEVVGIVFSLVGLMAVTVPQSDSIFNILEDLGMDRAALCRQMNEAAETCQNFCNECGVLHDLYIWLAYENYVLTLSIKGAADFLVWKRSGELFNTVIALGLHQEKKADTKIPFFLAELRKKTFTFAFANDKGLSTFLGRPPRLLSRYCLVQLPLDLSEKQLCSEGADLEAALANLDEAGWNKNGEIRRTTWARVWSLNALIREEILDLSLSLVVDDVITRAEAIVQRGREQYSILPERLKQSVESTERHRRPPLEQLCVVFTRLQHLTNDLLVQKILIRNTGADNKQLVEVARLIFEQVVAAAVRKDLMRDYQIDYADLLAVHGLRSAAILVVELLKQEHLPDQTTSNIPRSETIQNLSIFISCLSSIDPSDGTYAVCEQGRKIFKRVLDKILSPRSSKNNTGISLQTSTVSAQPAIPTSDNLDASLDALPADDLMQWLDNMEWERGSLMNFG